jgi:hypothetical protein
MPRSAHVSIIKIRKWFPPDDPLAAKMARLCILREDLLLEMEGVFTEDIRELDDHSAEFRRMYFLRNLVRTQIELSGAIQVLLRNEEFKDLLAKEPAEIQRDFRKAARAIGRAHPLAKEVRNDICGHVREKAVQEVLETIDPGAWGFLDISKIAKNTHYKFAGELTAAILLKGVSDEDKAKIRSSKWETIAELVPVFALIERCLLIYAQDRRLLP